MIIDQFNVEQQDMQITVLLTRGPDLAILQPSTQTPETGVRFCHPGHFLFAGGLHFAMASNL